MFREFMATYFKRALMIFPIAAIITYIPPYPLDVKLIGTAAFFVILLFPQLVEVLVVLHNARKQQDADVASHADAFDDDAVVSGSMSRKERRVRDRIRAARASRER